MRGKGYDPVVIDWVATNLVEAPGEKPGGALVWAFDIQGAEAMYDSYAASWYAPSIPWVAVPGRTEYTTVYTIIYTVALLPFTGPHVPITARVHLTPHIP
eukprot:7083301-Pyramimonas_sp.AAC.1